VQAGLRWRNPALYCKQAAGFHLAFAHDLSGRRSKAARRRDLQAYRRVSRALQDAIGIEANLHAAAQANVFTVDGFHQDPQPGAGIDRFAKQAARAASQAAHPSTAAGKSAGSKAAKSTVNVRAGLNWLERQASEDDLAVIYIASHGTARDQDEAGASYVVTFDTDVQSRDGLYSTAIPLVEISNVVRTRVKALKAVVILDACHSQGAVTQTVTVPASMPPQMLDHIREGTGRVIIGASQAEESSFESAKYGHGLFTYYLLQGLREQKDAPIEKIYEYVRAHVTQDAAANGWKQHPFLSASDGQSSVVLGIAATPLAWIWRGVSVMAGL